MIPVDQTIVDDNKGDCLRACVCSVLGLTITDAPNFAELDFFTGLDSWLAARGQRFLRVCLTGTKDIAAMYFGHPGTEGNAGPMLMWGHSPRLRADGSHRQHIVVAEPNGYGLKMIHDPHLSRAGLIDVQGFGWIIST